jgi:hypothetical protein
MVFPPVNLDDDGRQQSAVPVTTILKASTFCWIFFELSRHEGVFLRGIRATLRFIEGFTQMITLNLCGLAYMALPRLYRG